MVTRSYHRAHGRPRHPGRPPHDDRPARRHGTLDRDLRARPSGRRGSIRRSSRPPPATGRGSITTATARPRSTSCPGSGELHVRTDRRSSSAFDAAAGDFVYIPAGEIHVEANASDDRAARRRADPQLPRLARRLPRRRPGRRRRRAGALLRPGYAVAPPTPRRVRARAGCPRRTSPNDGWSGSRLTVDHPRQRAVHPQAHLARAGLDRPAPRATSRCAKRVVAGGQMRLVEPLVAPYLGSGSDGDAVAILMPDLSRELIAWEQVVDDATLERVLDAVARLHAMPWADYRATTPDWDWPWCPGSASASSSSSRPSAESYRAEGLRRRRPVPGRLGRLRSTAPSAGARLIDEPVGRPCAAAGRARPAAEDRPPRRPEARERRAARRRPGRAHRLADDVARARCGRARLAPRLEQLEPAPHAGWT